MGLVMKDDGWRVPNALWQRIEPLLPERYQNADSSVRDPIVLVDQTAEEITTFDLWHDLHRVDVALLVRYSKLDAAVRSLGVVVTGAARQNTGPRT